MTAERAAQSDDAWRCRRCGYRGKPKWSWLRVVVSMVLAAVFLEDMAAFRFLRVCPHCGADYEGVKP